MSCGFIEATRAAARSAGESVMSHIPLEARGSLVQSGRVYGPARTDSVKTARVVARSAAAVRGFMLENAVLSELRLRNSTVTYEHISSTRLYLYSQVLSTARHYGDSQMPNQIADHASGLTIISPEFLATPLPDHTTIMRTNSTLSISCHTLSDYYPKQLCSAENPHSEERTPHI